VHHWHSAWTVLQGDFFASSDLSRSRRVYDDICESKSQGHHRCNRLFLGLPPGRIHDRVDQSRYVLANSCKAQSHAVEAGLVYFLKVPTGVWPLLHSIPASQDIGCEVSRPEIGIEHKFEHLLAFSLVGLVITLAYSWRPSGSYSYGFLGRTHDIAVFARSTSISCPVSHPPSENTALHYPKRCPNSLDAMRKPNRRTRCHGCRASP
jgi:hypothetical protein